MAQPILLSFETERLMLRYRPSFLEFDMTNGNTPYLFRATLKNGKKRSPEKTELLLQKVFASIKASTKSENDVDVIISIVTRELRRHDLID